MEIKFNTTIKGMPDDSEVHECKGTLAGDVITFKCSQCNYVRRFNYQNNSTSATGGDLHVRHSGSFEKPTYLHSDN